MMVPETGLLLSSSKFSFLVALAFLVVVVAPGGFTFFVGCSGMLIGEVDLLWIGDGVHGGVIGAGAFTDRSRGWFKSKGSEYLKYCSCCCRTAVDSRCGSNPSL